MTRRNYPPPTWTQEAIIAAARAWNETHGRPPGSREWELSAPDHPGTSVVRVRFGNWNAMIVAAGLTPRTSGGQQRYTRAEILHAILVWKFEHGRLPFFKEWVVPSDTRPCTWHVQKLFGCWNAAIVAAGYEPRVKFYSVETYQRRAGAAVRRRDRFGRLVAA